MIKSMTGFGKAEKELPGGKVVVEIRSVNHRYGEVSVKMPRTMLAFEHEVRKLVAGRLKRGKIEVFVKQETSSGSASLPVLNIPLAKAYQKAFSSLREALGLGDPITLELIAAQKDVFLTGEEEVNEEVFAAELTAAVNAAVEGLDAMREREGTALLEDIVPRLVTLEAVIGTIAERIPQSMTETAARLRERIVQLLNGQPLDESRIAQEIAVMADRCDITEELVRFRSHLSQVTAALHSDEPVGRKLDFLLQELNREVNTIGSKANDADIAIQVVALKAELEKIREQIQNIE